MYAPAASPSGLPAPADRALRGRGAGGPTKLHLRNNRPHVTSCTLMCFLGGWYLAKMRARHSHLIDARSARRVGDGRVVTCIALLDDRIEHRRIGRLAPEHGARRR